MKRHMSMIWVAALSASMSGGHAATGNHAAATASQAVTTGSQAPASASPASPILLVVGHIDAMYADTGIAIVGGQVVHVSPGTELAALPLTGIFGALTSDGSIIASSVKTGVIYIAGASPVLLTGIVKSASPSIGQIKVGSVTVDVTNTYLSIAGTFPKPGDLVQLTGIQPVEGGLVLANKIDVGIEAITLNPLLTDMPAASDSIGGTGITGSGQQPRGQR